MTTFGAEYWFESAPKLCLRSKSNTWFWTPSNTFLHQKWYPLVDWHKKRYNTYWLYNSIFIEEWIKLVYLYMWSIWEIWNMCLCSYSLDSWPSHLSKAKCPIHLHQGSRHGIFVHLSIYHINKVDEPCSFFWWCITVLRPRCVCVRFSTKWTRIPIIKSK